MTDLQVGELQLENVKPRSLRSREGDQRWGTLFGEPPQENGEGVLDRQGSDARGGTRDDVGGKYGMIGLGLRRGSEVLPRQASALIKDWVNR